MKPLALFLALLGLLLQAGSVQALDDARYVPEMWGSPLVTPAGAALRSGPGPITDLRGYRESLVAALAELERGGQPSALQVAGRLRGLGPVAPAEGASVRPDVSGVLAALEAQPPDLAGARDRLRAVISELDRAQTRPAANWGTDPLGRLQNVLDRPEFRPAPPPDAISTFLQQLQRTVGEWIGRLLGPVLGWLLEQWLRVWGPGIGEDRRHQAAVAAGLLLIAGLIAWVVRGLRRAMGPAPAAAPGDGAGAGLPTAEQVRAEALRLAQAGDFEGAMRALYLAALLHWDEVGRLRFDRSLTNREVLARAKTEIDPALVGLLAPLVERFDRFWYGAVPCSAEDYADFSRLATTAWEAA